MLKKIVLYACFYLSPIIALQAQTVVITDDSLYTSGQSSAVLDLKSTSKGFLPPRVTAAQKNAIASPASGLMVYQSDEIAGYYLWTGTAWSLLVSGLGGINTVVKTVSDTITKAETSILASNSISVTLPDITAADNGLTIYIKNVGTYTDLVSIKPYGSSYIDANGPISLTRWQSNVLIAYNGNWFIRNRVVNLSKIYEVSSDGSFANIEEAIAFLNLHMSGPSVIRVDNLVNSIASTITINLPYSLTITGVSFGQQTISPASGLAGTPMFICETETYFKMLMFDATSLAGYGTAANEDAIWLTGANNYHEIKDASFDGFNKAVVVKNNIELWFFESDVYNSAAAGIEIVAGTANGSNIKISEVDFDNCAKSISLTSGINNSLQVQNCNFLCAAGQVGIYYNPSTYTAIKSLFVSSNAWNIVGQFKQGFDFTRTDGRDAECRFQNNVGVEDDIPHCKLNVLDNAAVTPIAAANTWYKSIWTNTSVVTTKWTMGDNRITLQPSGTRNVFAIITGNVSSAVNNRSINLAIVKNGVTSIRYGETTLRITTQNQAFQFSSVVYIQGVAKNDYLELFVSSPATGNLGLLDVNWYTEVK